MVEFEIPEALLWVRHSPEGREWLASLPAVVETASARWSLTVDPPFPYAYASLAFPVRVADGSPAVLKVQMPGRESELEAEALRRIGGRGAVRLLDHDPARHALLVERCLPGAPLSESAEGEQLDALIHALRSTWAPGGPPFRELAEEAAWWAAGLEAQWEAAGRPFERRLVDAARSALADLAPTQGVQVLVNQDLHAGNVLRASREPWLVIDPKPLSGEREFGVAPVVRDATGRRNTLRRLDRVTSELGLDRERARLWTLAQTVAWGFEGTSVLPGHVETARWMLDPSS